jgi:segregation and condensation protein B
MNQEQLKNIIEAALMVSEKPVSVSQLLAIFEKETDRPERTDIKTAIEQIMQDYEGRGIELKEVSSGYRVQVNGDYADWINHLFDDRPPRYSRALLETLAIIAYRQPVTRAEIEEIRGVSVSSNIIRTLQERSWIRVVGQRDIPGKPELLATTKEFLDYFNLKKLSELPSLSEIKDFDQINPDLFEELEKEAKNEVARNDLVKNELARAEMAGQQVDTDEEAANNEDETSSATEKPEEQTEAEENAINEEDNVVPFG